MHRTGTDPDDVKMTDVLCDFCRRAWSRDVPMVEGHRGACICGSCLALAYRALVIESKGGAPSGYTCTLCLESDQDRVALERADEPGWRSPLRDDAAVCRRCAKQAAGVLHRDEAFAWRKPEKG